MKLRYYGDPVLRQKAEPILEITPEVREIAKQMIELMSERKGCGLAATQVGLLIRLFVSNVSHEDEEGEIHYCDPYVVINPTLSNPSETLYEYGEGCLSIPGLYEPVMRPLSIDIDYLDLEGRSISKTCYGFLGCNMMHENDHLNGVLYIDRIKGKRRRLLEPKLQLIKKEYS